ncbi:major facilitator superfamily domain-containing protein [Suillus clintonianus]|uniref:major facilitator superfamily domain-containing protein n=1 Tax=Suillus clintonianus TaxID=1904413 RepID=UPI001B86D5AB|nr:major facilitator superfamily domain-containing protein [Suillus clintonianus]KAG2142480.1 major facilitator superfamily domain-containing protein [Suillus clintonianus]
MPALTFSGISSALYGLRHPVINPTNRKCSTIPVFSLNNQYSRNFHLSWLGFFVAFLSWFAFSPLIPDVIKTDLKLTSAEVGNSNIISLCSTLIVRVISGPLVDRYGPRKVMAGLLIIGAIPSGLAGTVSTVNGLYIVRFFIGILGGTFVSCQAWNTVFFDKNVVGRANALGGGWGNAGGGFTFIIMIALFNQLLADGMSPHVAWRAAFAIVPVPILLSVATATLMFGTDHPAGKWSDRHNVVAAGPHVSDDQTSITDSKNAKSKFGDDIETGDEKNVQVTVTAVYMASELDTAVNNPLTLNMASKIIVNPLTWLPSLAYMTTFGYELAIDANLATVLYTLLKSPTFGQTKAGYVAGIYGLLNVFSRPLGGYFGDLIYTRFGVPGKKYLTIACGVTQGLLSLGLGLYIDNHSHPSLAVIIGIFVVLAIFNEVANGVNFSLVPHCNPNSNGFMSGIVGAMGNLGGIIFAIIFRFEPSPAGKAFWISGVIAVGVNLLLCVIRVPQF